MQTAHVRGGWAPDWMGTPSSPIQPVALQCPHRRIEPVLPSKVSRWQSGQIRESGPGLAGTALGSLSLAGARHDEHSRPRSRRVLVVLVA